jgi:PhnB protein
MTVLNIYLNFDGDCAAAFDFYKSVFGGEFQVRQTFGEGPPDMEVKPSERSRILHVSLAVGDSVLMGSDTMSGQGEPFKQGNNFSISYAPSSKADADAKFAALSKGGKVVMPMQDMFWGAYFGMAKDKFGVNWMVNYAECK